ncbi:MAG: radical SAM protein [Spirochaetota bacterium]
MKKLLLINPVGRRSGILLSRSATFPPLSLACVAAVTPDNWEIKIIDENFDKFEFEEADLVGITAFTSNITRAYEIAGLYRARNIKVIMGGIHASMLPDEILQYADSVLVGEAEGIWGQVIDDLENNTLADRYLGPQLNLSEVNINPRHDLLHPAYFWHSVQTSRGCPFDCHFCSVSRYLGQKFRQRNIDSVLNELEGIKGKYFTFVDDNLIGYSEENYKRAIKLLEGMLGRNIRKKWWMQTSINASTNERIIELAAQSGCMFVFIGFETMKAEMLKNMRKGINLKVGIENYKRVIDAFHKYGIAVLGAFIIGNDYESSFYYKEFADFLVDLGVDIIQITMLTPLPGTGLMDQLVAEDRLIHKNFPEDWDKYRFSYVVHQPKGTNLDTIYIGCNYIKKHIYSFPTYQYRLVKSLFSLKNLTNFVSVCKYNKSYKKGWRNSHYYWEYPDHF